MVDLELTNSQFVSLRDPLVTAVYTSGKILITDDTSREHHLKKIQQFL